MYRVHSSEIRNSIVEYYRDDVNSRPCSGMKECLKVLTVDSEGSKPSKLLQKRLILYNIKDLYNNWVKDCHGERIPSFSLFASLRPR